jgi:hypothetical protein
MGMSNDLINFQSLKFFGRLETRTKQLVALLRQQQNECEQTARKNAFYIQDRLITQQLTTENLNRFSSFCGERGDKVQKAVLRYKSAFQRVLEHYGWDHVQMCKESVLIYYKINFRLDDELQAYGYDRKTLHRVKTYSLPQHSDDFYLSEFQDKILSKLSSGLSKLEPENGTTFSEMLAQSKSSCLWIILTQYRMALSKPLRTQQAINNHLITNLNRAAGELVLAVGEFCFFALDPVVRIKLIKGTYGITTEMLACAIRRKYPDWTEQQVADYVGCSRNTLNGYKSYQEYRKMLKAEALANHPKGSKTYQEDASGNKNLMLEAFADEKEQPIDDEDV